MSAAQERSVQEKTVLAVKDIFIRFGGVVAIDGVSFGVKEGSLVGIIGPNGAGKTTLFDAICGFVPHSGHVFLRGQSVTHLPAVARARLGLGRSFQDGRLFPSLTVRETLAVALERHLPRVGAVRAAVRVGPSARVERKIAERVDELIELTGLNAYRNKFVSELSTGTRRIADLACVVAHRPSVLLLDEPSSGIAQRETEALGPLILKLRKDLDCTVLIIEHDMPLVGSISDELIAMETGRIVARGLPQRVVNDPRVVEAYLGVDDTVIHRSGDRAPSPGRRRRPESSDREICGAKTRSGAPCRRGRVPGSRRCALHGGKADRPTPTRNPRRKG